MRRLLYVALALLICIGGIFLVTRATRWHRPAVLRICYVPHPRALPLFVAAERGLFDEAGLSVVMTPVDSTRQALDGLAAGTFDAAALVPVLSLYQHHLAKPGSLHIVSVALSTETHSTNAILVRQGSALKSPKELKERRIGIPPGRANRALARLAFAAHLDPDRDVRLVELQPGTELEALAERRVSALFAFEPVISSGRVQGISQVLERGPLEKHVLSPFPVAAATVSSTFAAQHPRETQRFVESWTRALTVIHDDEPQARLILRKHLNLRERTAQEMVTPQFWSALDLAQPERLAIMARYGALLAAAKLITKPVDGAQLRLPPELTARSSRRPTP